ncbi:MAG: hypothetical protein ACKOZW_12920 [Cyanobium sp.]
MRVGDSAANPAPAAGDDDLGDLLLEVLPPDGSTMGNVSAREAFTVTCTMLSNGPTPLG